MDGVPSVSLFTLFNNTGSPTAVELASLTAAWDKKRLVVEWETYTEKNNLGFYLWRTEAGQDAYTRLTRDLIPARGSASMGASYSYADYAVVRGREYLYKLEDVDRHGTSTFHGPVSATLGGGKKSKDNRMKKRRPGVKCAWGGAPPAADKKLPSLEEKRKGRSLVRGKYGTAPSTLYHLRSA